MDDNKCVQREGRGFVGSFKVGYTILYNNPDEALCVKYTRERREETIGVEEVRKTYASVGSWK